jgi:rubrerythrin
MSSWTERAALALRFKQNEHDLFRQLVRQAAADLPHALFLEMAEAARRHVSRLKEMAEAGAAEMDEESAHALRELTEQAEAARDEAGAILLGLDLKRQSCEFYLEMSAAADNAFERRFYLELASEERQGLLRLIECQAYLSDPPAYFGLKEHVSLDG